MKATSNAPPVRPESRAAAGSAGAEEVEGTAAVRETAVSTSTPIASTIRIVHLFSRESVIALVYIFLPIVPRFAPGKTPYGRE
jgi:hypothetical protein